MRGVRGGYCPGPRQNGHLGKGHLDLQSISISLQTGNSTLRDIQVSLKSRLRPGRAAPPQQRSVRISPASESQMPHVTDSLPVSCRIQHAQCSKYFPAPLSGRLVYHYHCVKLMEGSPRGGCDTSVPCRRRHSIHISHAQSSSSTLSLVQALVQQVLLFKQSFSCSIFAMACEKLLHTALPADPEGDGAMGVRDSPTFDQGPSRAFDRHSASPAAWRP